ncbi:MAG: NAD(P)/FAD-dependent oxidoreductase [Actinomycetales bacterium]|nr:NAD(P)/FAD-dependent oxidoreductase [Actinomycetales bacterium]
MASSSHNINETDVEVVVVGAGFAGMMAVRRLLEQGRTVQGIEKGGDVGGTWYWNTYPGLRCDVESVEYSYSWDEGLQQEWVWPERYSAQPDILKYAQHVAERFDLKKHFVFDTKVTGATFDNSANIWSVTTDAGQTYTARWVIMATGALSAPKKNDLPGAETFRGLNLYTTDWPKTPVDFAGKRVAVIGTGSTGIQVSSEIAKTAKELFVLQRTPSWSVPAHNRALSVAEVAEVKANYTPERLRKRESMDGLGLPGTGKSALEVTKEERDAFYQNVYDNMSPFTFFGSFTDVLVDDAANQTISDFLASKIRERVQDPAIAEKLIPKSYPFGTRRMCIDNGYYEIYNQDNVYLVDLLESPLKAITPTGFSTDAGDVDVDIIVYATGYDAFTGIVNELDIVGVDGANLRDVWKAGAKTYLGTMSAGFPNLFLVTGPQSPSVLSNVVVSIEQHVDFIANTIKYLTEKGYHRMEATPEAQDAWVEMNNGISQFTVHRNSHSWYMGDNVAGKAHVVLPALMGVGPFRAACDEVAEDGYRGFLLAS